MKTHASELVGRGTASEFCRSDLGDKRRNDRLSVIVDRLSVAPGDSFPKLVSSIAEREALYRFLRNEEVLFDDVLMGHRVATRDRIAQLGRVRVAHDTTDFLFSGTRDGLGPILDGCDARGMFLHAALAVSDGEDRVPLGIVGALPYVRSAKRKEEMKSLNERKLEAREKPRLQKESCRWELLAQEVSELLPTRDVIHVMDQEADDFIVIAEMIRRNLRFVIRGSKSRLLERSGPSLQSELEKTQSTLFRTVALSRRKSGRGAKHDKAHPPRDEREAELSVRWARVEIQKPQHAQSDMASVQVSVVQVFEPNPPFGEPAIEWTLLTSERVECEKDATLVVDDYRARWRIEEYFKALKQGCAIEKRQLESVETLLVAIALFMPLAWHLLALRTLAQTAPERPAENVVENDEIAVLGYLLQDKGCKPLPSNPTVLDVFRAIATIGGHIPQNGPPGWIVLGRGYETFAKAVPIWRAARRRKQRSDQS